MSNASDVVGPIPARLDGRLAEFEPPPEVLYPKYAKYLELRDAVYRAKKTSSDEEIFKAQAELEEYILSLCK